MLKIEQILADPGKLEPFLRRLEESKSILEFNLSFKGEPISEELIRLSMHVLLEKHLNKTINLLIKDTLKHNSVRCSIHLELPK